MMKKILILSLFLIIFINLNVYAQADALDVVGVGIGASKDEAKHEALSDLSSIIRVQVYSKFEMRTNSKGETDSNKLTRLTTDLPLLNPTIDYFVEGKKVKAVATLKNNEIYSDKIKTLADSINALATQGGYRALLSATKIYDDYNKYILVAKVMSFQNLAEPKATLDELNSRILSIEETPPSLEIAAEVLTNNISEKDIYVDFPKPVGSKSVTEFSKAFKSILSSKVSVGSESSRYKLICTYVVTSDMIMACNLQSGSKVLRSSIVNIPLVLLNSLEFLPEESKASSIFKEQIASNNFKSELRLETDGNPLIIKGDEKATILVKLNKPAYIYLIGYFEGANENYVYLPPIKLKQVDESRVNRWISLGALNLRAESGEYRLQLIATSAGFPLPSLDGSVDIVAKRVFESITKFSGEKSVATVTFNKIKR